MPEEHCLADQRVQQLTVISVGTAEALNIPEILSEAGPKGLHVTDIAKKADSDPDKLGLFHSHHFPLSISEVLHSGRILCMLATVHIFQQVAPDVFANNRLSSVMVSGKTLEEIKTKDEKCGLPE